MSRRILALAVVVLSTAITGCRQGSAPVAEQGGQELYTNRCAVCHGANREGVAGFTPALAGSQWVDGSPVRFAAIVIDGIQIPKGSVSATMPAWGSTLTDTQIAAVMTWLRQQDKKPEVDAAEINHARIVISGHNTFWTFQDLAGLPEN